MSEPKYVLFWGDETPKIKRPPAENEVYLWTKSDGEQLSFAQGEWKPFAQPEENA